MNELQIFKNSQFGEIRTADVNGKPYFVGADVARALGYVKPQNAISQHCKGALKQGIPTNGGEQLMTVVPEGDIYRLIVNSKLPTAEKFERWVFDEVLPSIRRHGAYMTPDVLQASIKDPAYVAGLLNQMAQDQKRIAALSQAIEKQRPKVVFADAVDASSGTCLVGELAKILKGNGVEIGQNRLFGWLRDNGYLIRRKGTDYNMPTQRSMELGLFKIKETAVTHSDGHVTVNRTPKITGKGQQYFVNIFLKDVHTGSGCGLATPSTGAASTQT